MSHQNFDLVDHSKFVARYTASTGESGAFKSGALQIYPLSIASSLIKPPTPLFRAEYSFLLLFSDGGGRQQVDNEIIELKPNDALFIREGHLNAIKSIDPATDGYFIHIDSSLLPQIFTDSALLHRLTFYPKHAVSGSAMEWICQCCALMLRQQTCDGQSEQIQAALLNVIVLKLAEASPTTLCRPDRQTEITIRFKGLLYDKFSSHRGVTFYADALAVSENYLNRCVSHTTGKPPKQHINELVIAHSKIRLRDQSTDISQVAFNLNFSDPSYFGRLFKQLTKQTPTEYRNALVHDSSGYVQGL